MKKREWLVEARKEKGYKQRDFADKVNIAKSYLSAIENGERTPAGTTALRMARELNLPMEWFYEEDPKTELSKKVF